MIDIIKSGIFNIIEKGFVVINQEILVLLF